MAKMAAEVVMVQLATMRVEVVMVHYSNNGRGSIYVTLQRQWQRKWWQYITATMAGAVVTVHYGDNDRGSSRSSDGA